MSLKLANPYHDHNATLFGPAQNKEGCKPKAIDGQCPITGLNPNILAHQERESMALRKRKFREHNSISPVNAKDTKTTKAHGSVKEHYSTEFLVTSEDRHSAAE